MSESETLTLGVRMGKKVMQDEVIAMFKAMQSTDSTDTEYSLSNVITLKEAIAAVEQLGKE